MNVLGTFYPKSNIRIFLGYSSIGKAYSVLYKRTLYVELGTNVLINKSRDLEINETLNKDEIE